MENEKIGEALEGAFETVLRVPAVRRRKNIRYAYTVKVGYEKIQKLRDEGYTYDTICEALVAKGVFDEGADSANLRSAYRRETKRRARRDQIERERAESEKGGEKPEKDTLAAESRKKLTRELTGGKFVDTGAGAVRKLPNGSFEF